MSSGKKLPNKGGWDAPHTTALFRVLNPELHIQHNKRNRRIALTVVGGMLAFAFFKDYQERKNQFEQELEELKHEQNFKPKVVASTWEDGAPVPSSVVDMDKKLRGLK